MSQDTPSLSELWETSHRVHQRPIVRSTLEILVLQAAGMSEADIAALPAPTVEHTLSSLCAEAFGVRTNTP